MLFWLERNHDLDVFDLDGETAEQVRRLRKAAKNDDQQRISASTAENRIAHVTGVYFNPTWQAQLQELTENYHIQIRARCQSVDPHLALRKQDAWQAAGRRRQLPLIAKLVLWPAYKHVVEDSGKKALHTGALGLILATIYWLVLTMSGRRPEFIADIGNGSAFGGFAGLVLAFTLQAWPFFWPKQKEDDRPQRILFRRIAVITALTVAVSVWPLTYFGVLIRVQGWLLAKPEFGAWAWVVVVTVGTLINVLRPRPAGTARASRAYYLIAIPGIALFLGAAIWADDEIPSWYALGVIWGSLALSMVAVSIAQILDNRDVNADRPDGVSAVPLDYVASMMLVFIVVVILGVIGWGLLQVVTSPTGDLIVLLLFALPILAVLTLGAQWADENKKRRPAARAALSKARREQAEKE
ncbi:hypothetical protein [Kineococcus sp. SYSU DK006]|uniref:hypothetical protein n=1 Tax=Kineococcus sp. SYSU DK006 TaxID=3383127 RepID=UPI003D7E93F2